MKYRIIFLIAVVVMALAAVDIARAVWPPALAAAEQCPTPSRFTADTERDEFERGFDYGINMVMIIEIRHRLEGKTSTYGEMQDEAREAAGFGKVDGGPR